VSVIRHLVLSVLAVALQVVTSHAADERSWQIAKSSGQVWTVSSQALPVSLTTQEIRTGDTVRTGQNGRVLLKRGDETILIAPNSELKLPTAASDGLSTTIIQKAGSILLDVEKKNVKHFEVETPYLAAVVKGTQFRVSVSSRGTNVNVVRGQVEVADFKSGQIAQVMPGQTVLSRSAGNAGLSLSGPGIHSPIQQGAPRTPIIERLPVPRSGLAAPRSAANGIQVRTLTAVGTPAPSTAPASRYSEGLNGNRGPGSQAKTSSTQISAPIGEVNLNINRVTNGLARGSSDVQPGRGEPRRASYWTSVPNTNPSSISNGSSSNTPNAATPSNVAGAAASPVNTPSFTPGASANVHSLTNNGKSGATGNGNGNRGSGDTVSGNGNSGAGNNGNGYGRVNGNNGNAGNGNNGIGNGKNGNSNGNNGNGNNGNGNGNGRK
jgi:hypothetical protein